MKKTKVTEIVHRPLADQVIELMQGQINNPKKRWDAPFNNLKNRPINAVTKNRYRGINAMLTVFDTYFSKYEHCLYATKKQWAGLGNTPKTGEKPLPIIFYKPLFEKSKVDPKMQARLDAKVRPDEPVKEDRIYINMKPKKKPSKK